MVWKTDGKVNIALGPVLSIWHNYMERYSADPTDAKLPKIESLMEKLPVCNIEDVIVDREAGTVYLAKEGMSLDVGAVAKGMPRSWRARKPTMPVSPPLLLVPVAM